MMNVSKNTLGDITQVIGIDRQPISRRYLAYVFALLAALGVIGAAIALLNSGKGAAIQFKTVAAKRGDLTVVVTATGTLQPLNQVDVGTEVSGTIKTVAVDFNDRVKVGQVLARLDTDRLEAQVLQSKATLESIEAKLADARATIIETRDNLERFKRVREMSGGKVPSQKEYDSAAAMLQRALAYEATLKAQISEAKWRLTIEQTNLAKAVIRSPINGIVLKRQVEPGQTVAASLQTPVLFTLAENLTQMELNVDVDEADVGQVKERQRATFTVDGYPGRPFPAVVTQVRYGPETVQGVVTYKTVLAVDNSDLSLRPGMTATAEITVKKLEDVLLVPNSALRFNPPAQEKPALPKGSLLTRLFPRPPPPTARPRESADAKNKQQRVWILRDGEPLPVAVATGSTDGVMTEITSGDLVADTEVVIDTINLGG